MLAKPADQKMQTTSTFSEALVAFAQEMPRVDTPCPACGEQAYAPFQLRNRMTIVRCVSCGSLYVRPRPPEGALITLYERFPQLSNGREGQERDDPQDGRREAAYRLRVLRTIIDSGCLLDLGCGHGDFLVAASGHFKVEGVDVSPRLRPEIHPMSVFRGRLEDAAFEPGTFDVVTAVEVLEHLFDPRRTLSEIHRILKPDGIFLFQTGDADSFRAQFNPATWTYLQPPVHLNVFSRKGLSRLASAVGFVGLRSWSFGRAPARIPVALQIFWTSPFRSILNLAARRGLLGEMHAWRRQVSGSGSSSGRLDRVASEPVEDEE